ncbi:MULTISPECIES: hypothetical protein [unclassified Cryobacterium]|nr:MULTISPECIES: hypothetical protein [unclassified Cryobacterium]
MNRRNKVLTAAAVAIINGPWAKEIGPILSTDRSGASIAAPVAKTSSQG